MGKISRRPFLRSSTAASAVAVSVPSIIPSSALGADDAVVPSE